MLSFLVSLIHVQEKKGKQTDKILDHGLSNHISQSYQQTQNCMRSCGEKQYLFKGIAAGNQNLTKLTFWERLNHFSIIRWRQSLCYCLSGLWANQRGRGARGQSDIWSDSFHWTLPGNLDKRYKGKDKAINYNSAHTQHTQCYFFIWL